MRTATISTVLVPCAGIHERLDRNRKRDLLESEALQDLSEFCDVATTVDQVLGDPVDLVGERAQVFWLHQVA